MALNYKKSPLEAIMIKIKDLPWSKEEQSA